MSYVPPHLRGRESSGEAPPPAKSGADRGSFGGSRGSFRDTDRDYRPNSFARSSSSTGLARASSSGNLNRSTSSGSLGPNSVEPKWPEWKPSATIQALSQQQIEDTRQRLNITVESDSGASSTVAPIESFDDMNLDVNIVRDIRLHEYDRPTPIQAQGIPVSLSGRDILGCAETGSGKTASFAIPMIQHCLNQSQLRRGDGPMAIVLAPTRELAQQIEQETQAFSNSSRAKVKTTIIVGGVSISEQRGVLRNGVEIIVATPGRLIDHLQQGNTALNRVSFLVLDEADRMLDMGFQPQIEEILSNIKGKRQTLLFSATMPEEIEKLARTYLNNPFRVKVGQVSTPAANVSQNLQRTTDTNKVNDLINLLTEEVEDARKNHYRLPLTIVFVERKSRCDDVAEALNHNEIVAVALHGGLTQSQREGALRSFTDGTCQVLVATDVASRGLDIKGIGHVINLDLPKTFEDYVHRIGRTGRAGATGRATSFYTDRDMFIVSQIKKALHDLESGNAFAFATGRAARAAEKELASKFKQQAKMTSSGLLATGSGSLVKVDDKYKFMAAIETQASGKADDAWDD